MVTTDHTAAEPEQLLITSLTPPHPRVSTLLSQHIHPPGRKRGRRGGTQIQMSLLNTHTYTRCIYVEPGRQQQKKLPTTSCVQRKIHHQPQETQKVENRNRINRKCLFLSHKKNNKTFVHLLYCTLTQRRDK